MVSAYLSLIVLLAILRLFELALSRRNAAWVFEQGGIEVGQGHFRVMKALHAAFLIGCVVEVWLLRRPFEPVLGFTMLGLLVLTQGLRYWAIFSLGKLWNVRVIVIPGSEPVSRGPYRFLRHPNYLAVVLEGIAIPLIHGAWITAVVFTVANALLLRVRIRVEERALAEHCGYEERFSERRRFLPRWSA